MSLLHIKRIKKIVEGKTTRLSVVLCSSRCVPSREQLCEYLSEFNKVDLFPYTNLSLENKVPLLSPPTKELAAEWSKEYWPMVWYGDPNDQILNDMVFDMSTIKSILNQITLLSQKQAESGNKVPVVTAFVSPHRTKDEVIYAIDTRSDVGCLPLDHSIMNGINKVALRRLDRRKMGNEENNKDNKDNEDNTAYLCLDYDVYTTHEPCSMCAMALIHSRVKRCIFIRQMERTGALLPTSGDGYCMHSNKRLNSKYEVFKWIGDEYNVPKLDSNTCC